MKRYVLSSLLIALILTACGGKDADTPRSSEPDTPVEQGEVPQFSASTPPQINYAVIPDLVIPGAVPNATVIQADGAEQIVLLYTSPDGLVEARSNDGITFSGLGEVDTALTDITNGESTPTDVILRQTGSGDLRYFFKALPPPGDETRLIYAAERASNGNLSLLNNGEPVYTEGQRVEVIDIIETPEGDWRMFYVALNAPPGNTHTAISKDEGLTWTFESDNPFGDRSNPASAESINVDPAPYRLNNGTYIAVTMRAGQLYFWLSDDGLNFIEIPGATLRHELFRNLAPHEVTGLFDPTLVQRADGTILLYVTLGSEAQGSIIALQLILE